MKISGFSFIRNAERYQYPVREALLSILPLCDEVVVAVGASSDKTRAIVASLGPKIRIIDTVWDDQLREGGKVLAEETNKAYQAIAPDSDWCVYIQGDEVLHEDGLPVLKEAMQKWKDAANVDGLLCKYRHFFGSYDYIGTESKWYRNEIRVVRKRSDIYSYRDAQGFRKGDNEKLNVKAVDAYVHHYGWVQDPKVMKAKFAVKDKINFNKETPEDGEIPANYHQLLVKALERYNGTHPAVMKERIAAMPWAFSYDESRNSLELKDHFKNFLEKITGHRFFEYKNYRII
jgi:glycosyltransferase involved in cell wall biosynthesis